MDIHDAGSERHRSNPPHPRGRPGGGRGVVLTMFEDDDSVSSAMRAGARGYVLKGAPPSEILEVVRAVTRWGSSLRARDPPPPHGFLLRAKARPSPPKPCPISPPVRSRSSTSSPRATPTPRSPPASTSAPRPLAITSPTSSPNCRSQTGHTPSSGPAKRDWAGAIRRANC